MTDLDRLLELILMGENGIDDYDAWIKEYEPLYEKLNDMQYKIKGLEAEVDIFEKINKWYRESIKEKAVDCCCECYNCEHEFANELKSILEK